MLAAGFRAQLRETMTAWSDDKVPRMGAALAYYGVFSVAPLLLIAVAIAGAVFGERAAQRELHSQLDSILGVKASGAVEEILGNVHTNGGGVLGGAIGVVVLLFGASGVFTELQDSLNSIWKVQPKPGLGYLAIVRDRLFSFLIVLATGFLLLALVVVGTVLNSLEHVMNERMAGGAVLWWTINQVLSLGLVTMLFAVLYKILPDARVEWRDVRLGAVIAALLFTAGKYLIGLYLARSTVTSAFGAAGSVIVILTWVYYSSQILLFGAEFTRINARYSPPATRRCLGAGPLTCRGDDRATAERGRRAGKCIALRRTEGLSAVTLPPFRLLGRLLRGNRIDLSQDQELFDLGGIHSEFCAELHGPIVTGSVESITHPESDATREGCATKSPPPDVRFPLGPFANSNPSSTMSPRLCTRLRRRIIRHETMRRTRT